MKYYHNTRTSLALASIVLGLSLPAIAQDPTNPANDKPNENRAARRAANANANPMMGIDELVAAVHPVSGSNVKGTVTFKKQRGGVEVHVSVGGLEPGSEHGFHIHEFGNVTSDDGNSAGGHYNPEGHEHGMMDADVRHAGDFGNLKADESGNANTTFTVDNITLAGRKNPIIGRAVVIHAKRDDGGQPTGNAGDRIGVGVIGVAKVKAVDHDATKPGDHMPKRDGDKKADKKMTVPATPLTPATPSAPADNDGME